MTATVTLLPVRGVMATSVPTKNTKGILATLAPNAPPAIASTVSAVNPVAVEPANPVPKAIPDLPMAFVDPPPMAKTPTTTAPIKARPVAATTGFAMAAGLVAIIPTAPFAQPNNAPALAMPKPTAPALIKLAKPEPLPTAPSSPATRPMRVISNVTIPAPAAPNVRDQPGATTIAALIKNLWATAALLHHNAHPVIPVSMGCVARVPALAIAWPAATL